MTPSGPRAPPDFVAVGHLTIDETPSGRRAGGGVLYAGLLAHAMGYRVGLLTSCGPDFPQAVIPPEIEVAVVPSPATTGFAIQSAPGGRALRLRARAAGLASIHLPPHFGEASIAYLAPVANEVAPDLAGAFPSSAVGVGAQGWCRQWDRRGIVAARPWPDARPVLQKVQALFLSEDDVAGWEERALSLYQEVPTGALTLGARGAILFVNGERYRVAPSPAVEREPTGAGDVFAATFMIHYNESGDPWQAAARAAVAGALAVEAPGVDGVPSRAALERRWLEEDVG